MICLIIPPVDFKWNNIHYSAIIFELLLKIRCKCKFSAFRVFKIKDLLKTKRINLCSGPRNVSTALMYSFSQRDDTSVLDEPFYACYLQATGKDHPGRDEVLEAQSSNPEEVSERLYSDNFAMPVLFIKNMAHHMDVVGKGLFSRMEHIFLIRDPAEMLISLDKTIPDPELRDTAYKEQYEIFQYVTDELGRKPIVIDSRELLLDPGKVLEEVCSRLDLDFKPEMLHWEEGPIAEDGVWARHWYDSVHRSTGFKTYEPKEEEVPPRLKSLLDTCMIYYEELYAHAIKANRNRNL